MSPFVLTARVQQSCPDHPEACDEESPNLYLQFFGGQAYGDLADDPSQLINNSVAPRLTSPCRTAKMT
jgi:hypothetical protein